MAVVIAGLVLFIINPALRAAGDQEADVAPPPRRSWFGLPVFTVLAAAAATTIVLGRLRHRPSSPRCGRWTAQQLIGWVLAIWGAGSMVGGLVYGAWHRSIAAYWLLGGLALVTTPVALATSLPAGRVLLFVSGLFCAPTITATVDTLSRLVPLGARGEAIGWHGSSMTLGIALGAPLAGLAIDAGGWQWGFVVVSAVACSSPSSAACVVRTAGRRAQPTPVDDSRVATAH